MRREGWEKGNSANIMKKNEGGKKTEEKSNHSTQAERRTTTPYGEDQWRAYAEGEGMKTKTIR